VFSRWNRGLQGGFQGKSLQRCALGQVGLCGAMERFDCIIIGAGAAGMFAAVEAGRRG
jgi:hypothetical protein